MDPKPWKVTYLGKDRRNWRNLQIRDECSSKLEYGKADQVPKRPSDLWSQSPKIETPGWGLGTEMSPLKFSP